MPSQDSTTEAAMQRQQWLQYLDGDAFLKFGVPADAVDHNQLVAQYLLDKKAANQLPGGLKRGDLSPAEYAKQCAYRIPDFDRVTEETIIAALKTDPNVYLNELAKLVASSAPNAQNIANNSLNINFSHFLHAKFNLTYDALLIRDGDLQNIEFFLNIPDFQSERTFNIIKGLKYYAGGIEDPSLMELALECLLKAEGVEKTDHFVLYRIGMIYLYDSKLCDLSKAEDYFRRAAKFAKAETESAATMMADALFGHQPSKHKPVKIFTSNSLMQASIAIQSQGKYTEALELAQSADSCAGSFLTELHVMRLKILNKMDGEITDNIKSIIDLNKYLAIPMMADDVFAHNAYVQNTIIMTAEAMENAIIANAEGRKKHLLLWPDYIELRENFKALGNPSNNFRPAALDFDSWSFGEALIQKSDGKFTDYDTFLNDVQNLRGHYENLRKKIDEYINIRELYEKALKVRQGFGNALSGEAADLHVKQTTHLIPENYIVPSVSGLQTATKKLNEYNELIAKSIEFARSESIRASTQVVEPVAIIDPQINIESKLGMLTTPVVPSEKSTSKITIPTLQTLMNEWGLLNALKPGPTSVNKRSVFREASCLPKKYSIEGRIHSKHYSAGYSGGVGAWTIDVKFNIPFEPKVIILSERGASKYPVSQDPIEWKYNSNTKCHILGFRNENSSELITAIESWNEGGLIYFEGCVALPDESISYKPAEFYIQLIHINDEVWEWVGCLRLKGFIWQKASVDKSSKAPTYESGRKTGKLDNQNIESSTDSLESAQRNRSLAVSASKKKDSRPVIFWTIAIVLIVAAFLVLFR